MHAAVTTVEVSLGRGNPKVEWPVVKLGQIGKAGASWHILDPNTPICGARGVVGVTVEEQDANVVRYKGRPVCARCRALLGPVELPKG